MIEKLRKKLDVRLLYYSRADAPKAKKVDQRDRQAAAYLPV